MATVYMKSKDGRQVLLLNGQRGGASITHIEGLEKLGWVEISYNQFVHLRDKLAAAGKLSAQPKPEADTEA